MRSTLLLAMMCMILSLFSAVPGQNAPETVLVQGSPPLTQKMVDDVTDFFEWVLEISLDPRQKDALKKASIDMWKRNGKEEIESILAILELHAKAVQATQESRDIARAQLHPEILKALGADASDQFSSTLIAAYRAAHDGEKKDQRDIGDDPPVYPITGKPPLTRDMVGKGVRLYEWMLDARLTEEQYRDFERSLVKTWRSGNSEEIAATVNVIKMHAELARKTEAERAAIREAMSSEYLDQIRKTPDTPESKWVLEIYYSSHTPIADGNPPLTRQAADAYAEVISFMIGEVVGGAAYKPDKEYKDLVAKSLAAQYSGLGAARQREYSNMPLVWAEIRVGWPKLSVAEKAAYRKRWTPGVQALIPAEPKTARVSTGSTPTPTRSGSKRPLNANTQRVLAQYESQQRTRRLLFNMNQDFLHKHYISPGWTYSKYSDW